MARRQKVDIGFVQSCNWEKHLDQAMPFIERGKPVFIDKPIVGSVKDIEKLRQLVKDGANILGSSSARYAQEICDFKAKSKDEVGEIVSIYATCGLDEFNYGIHVVEILSALAGSMGKSCRFVGATKTDVHCEIYNIEFENGIMGTYHLTHGVWQPFHVTILTTKGTYSFDIDVGNIYKSLLCELYNKLMGKKNKLTDIETLINCTQIMLCGKKSRDELNGAVVSVDMLGENDKFDGYEFEAEYAKTAADIYKD
ncbi:MAG: hypothetical protein E7395_06120 [Ruminococcaceae bacterium]|nr:hypothetical protein [Oscillospiraceae bacterium]